MSQLYKYIFVLLAFAMPALYLNKAGFSTLILLAFLLSLAPLVQNRGEIFNRQTWENIKQSKLLLLLGLFLITSLISSFMGINPSYSVNKWFQLLGVSIVGVALYTSLSFAKTEDFQKFLQYCYWSLSLFTLWALVDHLYLFPAFTNFIHGEKLKLSQFSSIIAIMIPFAVSHTLTNGKVKYWLLPFLAIAACILCGGRSGWIALITGFIAIYLLFPWEIVSRKKLHRLFSKFIFFGGIGFGFLLYQFAQGTDKLLYRVTLASPKGLGSGRLSIWDFTFQNYLEHPLLGIGVKGFRHLDFSEITLASHMHPHNAILEILLETGAVGLIIALSFVGIITWRLSRTIYQHMSFKNPIFHIIAISSFSAFIAYSTASLTLTSIFHAYWLGYFIILVVLMEIARKNILERRKKDHTQEKENKKITAQYPIAVSIIMPCHNSEKYLREAVESVLNQTYSNWELIICNNGTTDKSIEIAEQYAQQDKRIISLVEETGLGVGPAKNMGVKIARGRYITFLDSDDKWTDNKLEVQVHFMEKTGAALSGAHYHVMDDSSDITGSFTPSRHHVSYYSLLKANDIGCLTSMYDTHQLGKMYMPGVKVGSDLFLWLDMLKKVPFAAIIHKKLGYYRIHDGANTKNKNKSIKMRWNLVLSQKDVSYLRGLYYFCFYALNGLIKSLKGRFSKKFIRKAK